MRRNHRGTAVRDNPLTSEEVLLQLEALAERLEKAVVTLEITVATKDGEKEE